MNLIASMNKNSKTILISIIKISYCYNMWDTPYFISQKFYKSIIAKQCFVKKNYKNLFLTTNIPEL